MSWSQKVTQNEGGNDWPGWFHEHWTQTNKLWVFRSRTDQSSPFGLGTLNRCSLLGTGATPCERSYWTAVRTILPRGESCKYENMKQRMPSLKPQFAAPGNDTLDPDIWDILGSENWKGWQTYRYAEKKRRLTFIGNRAWNQVFQQKSLFQTFAWCWRPERAKRKWS